MATETTESATKEYRETLLHMIEILLNEQRPAQERIKDALHWLDSAGLWPEGELCRCCGGLHE
jgi:hypothetical protein